MNRLSDNAIEIVNELHTERLSYDSEYVPIIDALNRLAEYEDAEEQGLLVRLPCKLGDTVYWIMECSCLNIDGVYSKCEFYGYEPDYEADCEICNRPEGTKCPHQYRISEGRAREMNILMIARNLGKTVFLTREEAEKALEDA